MFPLLYFYGYLYRCLKANGNLAPDHFESIMVSDQLKYNGIAEIAKIRKMGYPVRKSYADMLKRYLQLHLV